MSRSAENTAIVAPVQDWAKWLFSQIGQLVIAVGLISLIFNYAYRYAVDWNVSSPLFYLATIVLALIVFVAVRRDYILVNRFEFSETEFSVHTLLGIRKTYAVSAYRWVPALHKTVNFPEKAASLSFYVQDAKTKKNIRNYSWSGFATEAFQAVSALYGYRGETDFKQKDFGRA